MPKSSAISLLFPLALGAGCQSQQRTDTSLAAEHSTITFQVDGMMKTKSGAT